MGEVSNTRKQILENTLTEELKRHIRIVPQEKYEQVLEQVFLELEYEECSPDTFVMRIQELLQVENVFNLQIICEGKDTQLNLKWNTLEEKKNETDLCLGCGTFQLNDKVKGLVEKMVGEKRVEVVIEVVVEKKEKGVLYSRNVNGNWEWYKSGNEKKGTKYLGEIENGELNGKGTLNSPYGKYVGEFKNRRKNSQEETYDYSNGKNYVREFKDRKPWIRTGYNKDGNITEKYVKG